MGGGEDVNTRDPEKNLGGQEAKSVDKGKRKADVAQPENSTDAIIVGEPVVSLMSLGPSLYDARTGGYVLNPGKKRQVKPDAGVAWGKLISQYSKTCLTITGAKGYVKLNGEVCPRQTCIPLNGGDEVIFSASTGHAYIFQQLSDNNSVSDGTPPVSTISTATSGTSRAPREPDTVPYEVYAELVRERDFMLKLNHELRLRLLLRILERVLELLADEQNLELCVRLLEQLLVEF